MHYVFWTEASNDIGAGHVMRCAALAIEVRSRGHEVTFLGEIKDLDWLTVKINRLGKKVDLISDYQPNPEEDILILDSYKIPLNSKLLSNKWRLVVVIADLTTHGYKCDLKIFQTLLPGKTINGNMKILQGPNYLLIRNTIEKNFRPPTDFPNIVITGGGSDSFNFCQEMAEILDTIDLPFQACFLSKREVVSRNGKNFKTFGLGANFEKILNTVDLAFSTASTSSLELIASEIPTGVVCSLRNQSQYYTEITKLKIAIPVGSHNSNTGWDLKRDLIFNLIASSDIRTKLKSKIKGFIDLNGPKRVIDQIESSLAEKGQSR